MSTALTPPLMTTACNILSIPPPHVLAPFLPVEVTCIIVSCTYCVEPPDLARCMLFVKDGQIYALLPLKLPRSIGHTQHASPCIGQKIKGVAKNEPELMEDSR